MTVSDRDKKLVVVVPALLLLVGYVAWFSATGKYTAQSQARAAEEKAAAAAPPPDRLRAAQARFAAAGAEADKAGKAVAGAKARLAARLLCVDPARRADRLHELSGLLTRNGMTVIEHAGADVVRDRLPADLEELKKQIPAAGLRLHRLRFAARYRDVFRLSWALAGDGAVAIPVSLTMKEAPSLDGEWHEWQLLVWV